MRLTFTVLFACWTIYSSSHAVLSLPPSLIANAASLQHQYHDKLKREHPTSTVFSYTPPRHKDVLSSSGNEERAANNEGGSIAHDTITELSRWNIDSGKNTNEPHQRTSRMVDKASSASVAHFNPHLEQQRKLSDAAAAAYADAAYDLSGFLQATKTADETDDDDDNNNNTYNDDDTTQSIEALPLLLPSQVRQSQAEANEFFTPLKYWASHCQPDRNCPEQQYYRALFANRNTNKPAANLAHPNGLHARNYAKNIGGVNAGPISYGNIDIYDDPKMAVNYDMEQNPNSNDNDIFMLLNGEQDVIKFLRWAMRLLYSNDRFANYTISGAEHYHPGMYIWKKLNLSGSVEPPLFVEEPHYIIVRREPLSDDIKMSAKYKNNDPFIPPRGRKHNMPDLDALLHRYETFVPNRGRRDKIKDMLKSDDLFFPNRGKKSKLPTPATMKRDLEYENGSNQNSNRNSEATSSSNVADIYESKSFNEANDDNGYKALPIALLMRDVLEKLLQGKSQRKPKAADNKITTNAHEINYFDDKSENPEWLQTMWNYKFNGNDPSVKQSMPAAVAINGETREMSTPQRAAARDHALQRLLQRNDDADGDDETGASGVDRGGTKIAANRLLSTRSMSTLMAHRRQQQKQRQRRKERLRQLQQHRRLMTTLARSLGMDDSNEYPQWQPIESDQKQHHQVKPLTNSDSLFWRQLQLQRQQQNDGRQHLQQKHNRQHQDSGFLPQETLRSEREAFDSPYTQSFSRAADINEFTDNGDYNYADI